MQRFSRVRDSLEMLIPPLPWDRPRWIDTGGPTVVLLHGLWRGWHAMEPLARVLRQEGFSTLNLPYPSTRLPIAELASRVSKEVARISDHSPVHFVTHSLGGIIARSMIAQTQPWSTGRIVMLAPPNNGSEIVDWSLQHSSVQRFLGPAGRALGSDGYLNDLPDLPENSEAAVIMGRRCSLPLFKHLLEDDNDGIVSASRGKIKNLRGFSVIDADHTFIQMHPDALRIIPKFLKTGAWPEQAC